MIGKDEYDAFKQLFKTTTEEIYKEKRTIRAAEERIEFLQKQWENFLLKASAEIDQYARTFVGKYYKDKECSSYYYIADVNSDTIRPDDLIVLVVDLEEEGVDYFWYPAHREIIALDYLENYCEEIEKDEFVNAYKEGIDVFTDSVFQ